MTLLHWAADRNHLELAQFLLSNAHMNVNAQSHEGETALYLSVVAGNERMSELLVNSGADPHLSTVDGDSPALHKS